MHVEAALSNATRPKSKVASTVLTFLAAMLNEISSFRSVDKVETN